MMYEIESAVEDYIRSNYNPSDFDELKPDDCVHGSTDMDELFESTIECVVEEIASRSYSDMEMMVTEWCERYQNQIDAEFGEQIEWAVASGKYMIEN